MLLVKEREEYIAKLTEVLELDDISLEYLRTDVSPVSKASYYTFAQCAELNIDGENTANVSSHNLLKLIVDKDGYTAGISSDLSYGEFAPVDESRSVSKEQAEQFIQKKVGKNIKVYTDYTKLDYWNDQGVADNFGFSSTKNFPVWLIATDVPNIDDKLPETVEEGSIYAELQECPYLITVVSAIVKTPGDECSLIATYLTDSLTDIADATDIKFSE